MGWSGKGELEMGNVWEGAAPLALWIRAWKLEPLPCQRGRWRSYSCAVELGRKQKILDLDSVDSSCRKLSECDSF